MNNIIMNASNILISEATSNRRYMSLSMRMFSTRENLNHVAVTEAFIDSIVANKQDYICMPLCADVPKMKKKDYRGLTHLYDSSTGTFLADVIGGFYDFEKVADEYGVSLIGHARVNKRCAAVCEAIEELYANNALNFSFEISAGDLRTENNITIVDASDSNELTAMAVVSVPAYPESKALELVAEAKPSMEDFYKNTTFLAAEMDVDTVRMRLFDALVELLGEKSWHMRPLLFCVDCVVMYDELCGESYKVEYRMDGDDLILTDFYEIKYVRAEEGENEMEKETMMEIEQAETTEAQEVIETAEATEVQAEETVESTEESTTETATEQVEASTEAEETTKVEAEVEDEKDNDASDDEDDELQAMKAKCAELEQAIAELRSAKEELDKIKAEREEAEANAKKAELREFAIAEGLNVEDEKIAEAIDKMDHASLLAEVMTMKKNAKKESGDNVAFVASFGISQKGTSYLLGHSKD